MGVGQNQILSTFDSNSGYSKDAPTSYVVLMTGLGPTGAYTN